METWCEVFGSLRAVVTFAALLIAPGYCIAWVLDLHRFRAQAKATRIAWATVLSIGIVPFAATTLAKYSSLNIACWAAILLAIGCTYLAIRDARNLRGRPNTTVCIIAATWIVFVIAELVAIAIGDHLYISVTIYDHAQRSAFVDAVLRSGVPPSNPLFWPGHAAQMPYYYYWYVVTAIAARLASATGQQAMIASVVWSGFGIAALLYLYCEHFLPAQPTPRRRPRIAIALMLLCVTGLDVVVELLKFLAHMPLDGDPDWWSHDLVSPWIASLLYVPHHIAGLIACLAGFLVAWISCRQNRKEKILSAVIAGTCFASAFGLSVWVAIAFAMTTAAWAIWSAVFEPESRDRVTTFSASALVGALLALPYALEIKGAASTGATASAHLLNFGIRRMIDPRYLQIFGVFREPRSIHPTLADSLAALLLLTPGYFLELGFWLVVLLLSALLAFGSAWRSRFDAADRAAFVQACASLLISSFLRSSVISSNDFGFRSILIAQFFLVLLAVRLLERAWLPKENPWRNDLLRACLWIGIIGTAYQVTCLRVYLPVEEAMHRTRADGLAEYSMAVRNAFKTANGSLPDTAVVQSAVEHPSIYFNLAELMLSRRQAATTFEQCGTAFGGDPTACNAVEQRTAELFFAGPGTSHPIAPDAARARSLCARGGIDALIATRWDAVWYAGSGWLWNLPALAQTKDARIVQCTTSTPKQLAFVGGQQRLAVKADFASRANSSTYATHNPHRVMAASVQ